VPNPSQTNSDSGPQPPAGNVGGWSNGPTVMGDDVTVANGDSFGDDCDPDMDNDGRVDANELAGNGCGGAVTRVDGDNTYNAIAIPGDGGTSWDSDGDSVPDGRECAIGTNPLLADMAHVGACAASVGMGDAEPDGIQDAWEVCKWGTSPSNPDSDGDGRSDCIEVLDVNGNGVANAADATLIVRAASLIDIGDLAAEDINGNGLVNVADRTLLLRLITGIDPSGGLCM